MKSLGPARSWSQPPLNRAPLNVKPEYSKGSHDPYLYQTYSSFASIKFDRKITYPKPDSGNSELQSQRPTAPDTWRTAPRAHYQLLNRRTAIKFTFEKLERSFLKNHLSISEPQSLPSCFYVKNNTFQNKFCGSVRLTSHWTVGYQKNCCLVIVPSRYTPSKHPNSSKFNNVYNVALSIPPVAIEHVQNFFFHRTASNMSSSVDQSLYEWVWGFWRLLARH